MSGFSGCRPAGPSGRAQALVGAVVEAQLSALQDGDFATAYDFAASGIRRQFDERLFTVMIKRGYAPLLRPDRTDFGVVRDDGERAFRVLSNEEVEHFLTVISERD